jgi:DNA topoisomerase-1
MTNLVIVESPAKCAKIQGFLGQGWKVIASLGHIRKLTEDLDAVGLDRDFEAKWEFMTKE